MDQLIKYSNKVVSVVNDVLTEQPSGVFLTGSRVMGYETEASDYDVLVTYDELKTGVCRSFTAIRGQERFNISVTSNESELLVSEYEGLILPIWDCINNEWYQEGDQIDINIRKLQKQEKQWIASMIIEEKCIQ